MQSEKWQNDLCSFPRQTIQYHSNPAYAPTSNAEEAESLIVSLKIFYYFKICKDLYYKEGFPGGSWVENPPANAEDAGLIPRLGRSPGEGNGNLLQYSCLGNHMDRGAWWVMSTELQRVGHSWAGTHCGFTGWEHSSYTGHSFHPHSDPPGLALLWTHSTEEELRSQDEHLPEKAPLEMTGAQISILFSPWF